MTAERWVAMCAAALVVAGGARSTAQPRGAPQVTPRPEWAERIAWPPELPAPAMEPISTAGVIAERRLFPDRVAELRVRGSGDGARIWREWLAAVRASGGIVEAERSGGWGASASVCAGACARGRWFASMANDSWVWVTLRAAVSRGPAAPGACTVVPDDRWRICWTTGSGRANCSMPYETRWDVDLDRDGFADARVPRPRPREPSTSCPQDVEWDLYAARGACGHAVGHVRGDVSRWRAIEPALAQGWIVLGTEIEPAGPWDSAISHRYAFAGGATAGYRRVSETHATARCDVHPADCEDMSPMRCALRGHPTIRGPFDFDAASSRLSSLAVAAQGACAAGVARPVRCEVSLRVERDGTASHVRVNGCAGAPRRCVERAFAAATFTPFTGDPAPLGISFQLPAP